MFAIVTSSNRKMGLSFYGPFSAESAAYIYAKQNKITKFVIVYLQDSGECLDIDGSD